MSNRPESVTYIAKAPCGCVHVAVATYVNVRPPVAWMRNLMDAVADGCTLETVSTEWMREHFTSTCDVCKPLKTAKPVQTSLLELAQ